MKIAMLSPFEEPVPPKKYGGTELVVYNLCEELKKAGHEVHLVASGDSKTSVALHPVFEKSIRRMPEAQDMKMRDMLKYIGIGRALRYLNQIDADIVHNHIGWRMLPFAELIKNPVVTTLHGPLDVKYRQPYYDFPDANYVTISNSQRKPLPTLNFIATVYNGIDIARFPFSDKTDDYFAFLGRMSPEKGPVQAIRAAKKLGAKLVMAAKVDAVDVAFFEREVKPLIDGKRIVFLGEVGHRGKVALLKNARALFAPIQWREPFGLFFVEAMACGTPVIANNAGSAKEVVADGTTGFVVDSEDGFIKAARTIDAIRREDCRRRVEENFTSAIMAKNYVKVYERIATGQ